MRLTADAEGALRVQEYGGSPQIDGVRLVALRRFNDAGGAMTELLRLPEQRVEGLEGFEPAQINYSTLHPGVIKAFHVHRRQTDVWFVPPEDRLLVVLVDLRDGSPTGGERMRLVLGDTCSALLRIPPGVAHGCRNIGENAARIIYLTDMVFSPAPATCDEGRLSWDLAGEEVWETPRE